MSRLVAGSPPVDPPATPLLGLIAEGVALLEDERRVFLTGTYCELATITDRKREVLERLEDAIPATAHTADEIDALRRLIAISRRNEEIIQAARQGLAHARRRILSIRATGRGAVAYAEDGSPIACRADRLGNEKSA